MTVRAVTVLGVASVPTGADEVVSCEPCHLNQCVATAAHAAGIHDIALTEDVATMRAIKPLIA